MTAPTRPSTCRRPTQGGAIRRPEGADAAPAPGPPPAPSFGAFLLREYNNLRDELVNTLCARLGNREDAQDVAQETFLRCWHDQERLPGVRNLRAWIFRVGLNAAKDLRRSAWSRRVRPLLGADVLPTVPAAPSWALEEQELLGEVRGALKHLRPEEKEVFLLRQDGQLTYQQIARQHSRPVGTVKTQMRSALQRLRELFNPHRAPARRRREPGYEPDTRLARGRPRRGPPRIA
jgi:RNA polymerase sigma-70 factor (ECF subfamily)